MAREPSAAIPRVFDRAVLAAHRRRALARFIATPQASTDFLLRRTLDDLSDRLSFIQRRFNHALLLGAHIPRAGTDLAASAQIADLVTSDQLGGIHREIDEEAIANSLAPESLDLVVSPLVLHWVNDLPGALVQLRMALKPDGLLMVSLLGGATLRELRTVLLEAESEIEGGASPRVAPFCDVRDLGSLLQRAGLALPVTDSDTVRVTYPHLFALMQDLRAMGAANCLVDRKRGPLKRATLMRAQELYAERHSVCDGRISATFEILTATAWAPAADQQKPLRPGSAAKSLADALGTRELSAGEKPG